MSKILIVPDIHYCRTSSIIRSRGKEYSTRIENCIKSINWCEDLAIKENCTSVIYLGDFFDSDDLDSEVLSSLNKIKFNTLPHLCLAGNHEISTTNNEYTSISLLQNFENINVITKPLTLENENVYLHLLPYIYEIDSDPRTFFDISDKSKKHILLSHNDIKGIYYGRIISQLGLDIDLLDLFDLTVNGHIHNNSWVTERVLNLGLLTGQNFNEDAFKYKHQILILDTDNLSHKEIENPYAFNFYKIDIEKEEDINQLNSLKQNVVASLKCNENLLNDLKQKLDSLTNITEKRITVIKNLLNAKSIEEKQIEDLSVDHLQKLNEFCLANLDNTDILLQELQEICK